MSFYNQIVTIWDFSTNDSTFQPVIEAMSAYVKSKQITDIYVTKQSELIKRIIPQEVHEFLLKLQDNDHILQVTDIPSELKGAMDWDIDKSDHFSFLISDVFEEWYESYIIKKESSLKNQTYLNLLRILDTMLSVREVIQLHNTTTVQIPFLPQRIRYRELMLQDDVGGNLKRQSHEVCLAHKHLQSHAMFRY